MASEIKSDKLSPSTGTSLTIGDASDTITIPTGATFTITDGLAVSGGGTGLTSFTAGDILYATGTTTLAKLAKGTAEQVLAMNSGATAPDWGSVDLTVLPTITAVKGGTGQTGFTAGDLLYANSTTTLAKLGVGSGSDTLKMNSGATAPEWVTVAAASSDFVKLATVSCTAAPTVVMDGHFSATYDKYYLYWQGIYPSAHSDYLRMRVNASGTAITASNYRTTQPTSANNGGTGEVGYKAQYDTDHFFLTNDASNTHGTLYTQGGWLMTVNDPLGTAAAKIFLGDSYVTINGGGTYNWRNLLGCTYNTAPALSGFTFYWSTGGNFAAQGDFILYGVK